MHWLSADGYWQSRLIFTRALSVIYLIAFVAARNQFRPLLGSSGMLPIPRFLARSSFRRSPSLFHWRYSDDLFETVCWVGVVLSLAVLAGGVDQLPAWGWIVIWLVLWWLYLSIINVGQIWYGFGWESLLVETGFLAAFLGPAAVAPPTLVLWLLRWLLFRLEFGAGLIKMRGDRCWRDLTCLYYHHETQPLPNPLSWYFHHLPRRLHKVEVLANHATQLVLVFGLFTPQPYASLAAAVMVITQGYLMVSGNFAWLNALTMTLALSVIDGRYYQDVFGLGRPAPLASPLWFLALSIAVFAVVVVLSYWPARNLLSRRQAMNASFNSLHLVNTYGAFGSITRDRHELVLEGTVDPVPTAASEWREYEFKGKPNDPRRRPPQVAPYHLRLDWLMWFAGISMAYAYPWLDGLLDRLERGDRETLKLLRRNPFPDQPPAVVRVRMYRYRYSSWRERRESGVWWVRTPVSRG